MFIHEIWNDQIINRKNNYVCKQITILMENTYIRRGCFLCCIYWSNLIHKINMHRQNIKLVLYAFNEKPNVDKFLKMSTLLPLIQSNEQYYSDNGIIWWYSLNGNNNIHTCTMYIYNKNNDIDNWTEYRITQHNPKSYNKLHNHNTTCKM